MWQTVTEAKREIFSFVWGILKVVFANDLVNYTVLILSANILSFLLGRHRNSFAVIFSFHPCETLIYGYTLKYGTVAILMYYLHDIYGMYKIQLFIAYI